MVYHLISGAIGGTFALVLYSNGITWKRPSFYILFALMYALAFVQWLIVFS